MKHGVIAVSILFLGCTASEAPKEPSVQGEEITYTAGDVTMHGYLTYDSNQEGKRPGVLVVHEWWGHNDYARKRATMLAEMGYTALALDMYGDGKQADHPEDAGKFATAVMSDMEAAKARFGAAMQQLKSHPSVDPDRIAAIGYCFGGAVVLQMARAGLDLDGVVSFHGSYATQMPAEPGKVKAAVLVCHGAEDPFVKPEEVEQLKEEMNNAGVDFKFVAYEGAKHSFTNPAADEIGKKFGLPLAYNEAADKKSWAEATAFFERIFSQ